MTRSRASAGCLIEADTGLSRAELIDIIAGAVPRPAQQRTVLWELQARPELLRGGGAFGSVRLIALIEALVARQARNVIAPACPYCQRTARLNRSRDGLRCCRSCYDQHNAEPCSRCGAHRPVATRTARSEPLCVNCRRADPDNHEPCTRCGRIRLIRHRDDEVALCGTCWRAPIVTCSICRKPKPCYFADTDNPRCEKCSSHVYAKPCGRCRRTRPIYLRTSDGDAVCDLCYHHSRTAPCSGCGQTRQVAGHVGEGPLCRKCYPKHPAARRCCVRCGDLQRLHHHGLCSRCAATRQLRVLLARPDGTLSRHVEPILQVLLASSPATVLEWLTSHTTRRVLADLAATTQPITHDTLDRLQPAQVTRHLRAVLVAGKVLSERDEYLAELINWLERLLPAVPDPNDRKILHRYATWHHLRRLRSRPSGGPTTFNQVVAIRYDLKSAVHLLIWLHQHGRSLATCTQADIDTWMTQTPPSRHVAGNFVHWARNRGHTNGIEIPRPTIPRPRTGLPDTDMRWRLLHRMLHDDALHTSDRVAGCLILLYGQPLSRITLLTTDHIHQDEHGVQLTLGTKPFHLPAPLDALITDLVSDRRGHAVIGHTDDHHWLFPGGTPGRPITPGRLQQRLRRLGIHARHGRNTTLMDLASQLPAAVLSQLLGIHTTTTATDWATAAGNTRPGYAADLARRATSR